MSKTISLTLEEFIILESELNGLVNLQTGEKISKGILDYSMPMKARYNLGKLVSQAEKISKKQEAERKRLIETLGGEEKSIPRFIKGENDADIINPTFELFVKGMQEFMELKEDLLVPDTLSFKDIESIESSENIKVLLKVLDPEIGLHDSAMKKSAELPELPHPMNQNMNGDGNGY